MATLVTSNKFKDAKAEAMKSRWAKARIDIEYIDPTGTKQSLHYELDLESPINDDPVYQIGISELT